MRKRRLNKFSSLDLVRFCLGFSLLRPLDHRTPSKAELIPDSRGSAAEIQVRMRNFGGFGFKVNQAPVLLDSQFLLGLSFTEPGFQVFGPFFGGPDESGGSELFTTSGLISSDSPELWFGPFWSALRTGLLEVLRF